MRAQNILKLAAALAPFVTGGPASATVTLSPYLPSSTLSASGASATFIRIGNEWKGSTVLWTDPVKDSQGNVITPGQYGVGTPISSFGWGTGLWGIDDFEKVLSGAVAPVGAWSGLVSSINFGDNCYNQQWSESWGGAAVAPLFSDATGCYGYGDGDIQGNAQDNWISYFTGYIRITDEGSYNFGVLNDDGFFFNLIGAGGTQHSISRDFLNPRERTEFGTDFFWLSQGLYRFELGAYDRLEAGVVDLAWKRGGATDWQLVPTDNLVNIPEPGTLGLLATGLVAVGLSARRHARRVRAARESHVA